MKQKLRLWEESSEALDKDFRSASKCFWKIVRKAVLYSAGVVLRTSTEYIVRQWKEYFKDPLNPTGMPSIEEASLATRSLR